MKILAVDDDPLFLDILNLVLVDEGYDDITLAYDAAQALQLISEADASFDCFLIDMVMPKMDGVALCRQIRGMPCYRLTPILMVTALADEISVDRAFIAGANDFVTKPLNALEIVGRIRSAGILVQQTNRKIALEESVHLLESAIINLSKPRSEEETEVIDARNCLSIKEHEDMLRTLPNGMYAISCFAIRISETATLLGHLPREDFESVLAEVAKHISSDLGMLHHSFAYYGNGTFGGVVFGRKARLKAEKGLNCFGIRETVVVAINMGVARKLTLCLREEPTLPLLSGEQAVKSIRDAVAGLEKAAATSYREDYDYLQLRRRLKSGPNSEPIDLGKISQNIFLE